MTKQRDKACKQDINRILLLDLDSLGFESFGFGILNCPSLCARKNFLLFFNSDETGWFNHARDICFIFLLVAKHFLNS